MPKSIMSFDALSIEMLGQQSVKVATTLTPTVTTVTVDWNNGNHQTIDLHSVPGDLTAITFNNPKSGSLYSLTYIQRATTPRQAPFSAYGGTWNMPTPGYAPKITTVNDSKTRFWIYYDGTTYCLLPDQPIIAQDLTELAAIGTGINGQLVYVVSLSGIYILDVTNSYTPDGLGVIAASGAGYWIGQLVGRWDDVQGSIAQGTSAAALTYEAFRDTPLKLFHFAHNNDDELHMVFQFPHGWKADTAVVPHLHVVPCADPAASENIYLEGKYTWNKTGDAIPAVATWTTITPVTSAVAPGDVYKSRLISLGSITPPSSLTASSMLLFYLKRSGLNVLDTYTTSKSYGTAVANLALLFADVHFRNYRVGTVTESA